MAQLKTGTTIGGRNIVQELDSHKNDYVSQMAYAVANGTDTYTVSIPGITSLVEGLSVKVKFQNANTGPSTLNINGLGAKEIRKGNGNVLSADNIKAGQICHLVYNGVNFQLLGEGGEYGTALPEHVLEGYTIGTENGVVQGTMPNQGRKIITPGTTNIAIPRGYHDGTGYVQGSANLKPENIKNGVNIFGVTGTFTDGARILSGVPIEYSKTHPKTGNATIIETVYTFPSKCIGFIWAGNNYSYIGYAYAHGHGEDTYYVKANAYIIGSTGSKIFVVSANENENVGDHDYCYMLALFKTENDTFKYGKAGSSTGFLAESDNLGYLQRIEAELTIPKAIANWDSVRARISLSGTLFPIVLN